MLAISSLLWSLSLFFITKASASFIGDLPSLYAAIVKGPNRKVGFLTQANYNAVRNVLPSNVDVVIAGDEITLNGLIDKNTVLAGLLTQTPKSKYQSFSSGLLSPQAMLSRKNSSSLLRQAIDAAIVNVIVDGGPTQFALNNEPTTVIIINTCNPDKSAYPFPSKAEVANEPWFQRGYVNIGALGPYNWGQSGNYLSSPYVGFWPEYYDALEAQFYIHYGVNFTRVWSLTSDDSGGGGVLGNILNGKADITEPYYLLTSNYHGNIYCSLIISSFLIYSLFNNNIIILVYFRFGKVVPIRRFLLHLGINILFLHFQASRLSSSVE